MCAVAAHRVRDVQVWMGQRVPALVVVVVVTRCMHFMQGAVYHVVSAPMATGSEVEVEVDWARRYDHMQQHTGQHVVSAVADTLLGADTCSWELHPASDPDKADMDTVTVDLSVPTIEPSAVRHCCGGWGRGVQQCSRLRLRFSVGRRNPYRPDTCTHL